MCDTNDMQKKVLMKRQNMLKIMILVKVAFKQLISFKRTIIIPIKSNPFIVSCIQIKGNIFLDPRAYSFDGIQVSLNFLLNDK